MDTTNFKDEEYIARFGDLSLPSRAKNILVAAMDADYESGSSRGVNVTAAIVSLMKHGWGMKRILAIAQDCSYRTKVIREHGYDHKRLSPEPEVVPTYQPATAMEAALMEAGVPLNPQAFVRRKKRSRRGRI